MKSKRQTARAMRQRRKLLSGIVWGGVGLITLSVVGYFIWTASRPTPGESIAVMPELGHVAEGADPGPYNSDPPTSGKHYASEFDTGFYEETDTEAQAAYPEGYLVHNLEHGYVIFWYNCRLLAEQECQALKSQVREVMERENNFKVIAFPRTSLDVPVVMTSWGRMQRFESFDMQTAQAFVRLNRNKAPEPNAP